MTLKNPKFSQTNKNLLENFDLGEELKDKNGEKISGGATFSFENRTQYEIVVNLLNGSSTTIILEPSSLLETPQSVQQQQQIVQQIVQQVTIPGNLITVQFQAIPGSEDPDTLVRERMISNRTGIFDLDETINPNRIVFFLE